jgi:hypothetical protein
MTFIVKDKIKIVISCDSGFVTTQCSLDRVQTKSSHGFSRTTRATVTIHELSTEYFGANLIIKVLFFELCLKKES